MPFHFSFLDMMGQTQLRTLKTFGKNREDKKIKKIVQIKKPTAGEIFLFIYKKPEGPQKIQPELNAIN